MGKNDVAVKRWIGHAERFADLYNGTVFGGCQIIKPEELQQIKSESDLIFDDKNGKKKVVHKYRDVVMRWKNKMNLAVLACENQEKVHYAMPVRTMLYDSLSYVEQINQLWKQHKEDKSYVSDEEFLSHFKKEDKLRPVITLVLYYGEKKWDGSRDLHHMLHIADDPGEAEILRKLIPNYYINLIDVSRIGNSKVFRTDLQLIFGMLQYKNKKQELIKYVRENEEFFSKMDYETYCAAEAFLKSESKLRKIVPVGEGKEAVNMCKALDDLYNDGMERGMEQKAELMIHNMFLRGMSVENAAEIAGEDMEKVKQLYKEWKK